MIDAYFITEVSWEVANKVGGIYTVLSSRAGEMMHRHGAEQVLFVGPHLRPTEEMVDFRSETFCITLPSHISLLGVELPITQGYWLTPGAKRKRSLWTTSRSPQSVTSFTTSCGSSTASSPI